MPSLFDRLKQRKLIQWTLTYVAGAWVALQVLDVLADVHRGVLVVAGVGLVITVILAWFHGEQGRQRVTGSEILDRPHRISWASTLCRRGGRPSEVGAFL